MKLERAIRYMTVIVALLTLAASNYTLATSQKTEKSQLVSSDVERQIREVDEERSQALRRNDVQALARLYSDDFMMITPNGEIRTKQDQLRDISAANIQHQGSSNEILKLRALGMLLLCSQRAKGNSL